MFKDNTFESRFRLGGLRVAVTACVTISVLAACLSCALAGEERPRKAEKLPDVNVTFKAVGAPNGGPVQAGKIAVASVVFSNSSKDRATAFRLLPRPGSKSALGFFRGDYRKRLELLHLPHVIFEFLDENGVVVQTTDPGALCTLASGSRSRLRVPPGGKVTAYWEFFAPAKPGSYTLRASIDTTLLDYLGGANLMWGGEQDPVRHVRGRMLLRNVRVMESADVVPSPTEAKDDERIKMEVEAVLAPDGGKVKAGEIAVIKLRLDLRGDPQGVVRAPFTSKPSSKKASPPAGTPSYGSELLRCVRSRITVCFKDTERDLERKMRPATVASAPREWFLARDSQERQRRVTCMCRAPSRPGRYDLSIEIDTTPFSEFGTERVHDLGTDELAPWRHYYSQRYLRVKYAFIKRTLHFKNVEVIQE